MNVFRLLLLLLVTPLSAEPTPDDFLRSFRDNLGLLSPKLNEAMSESSAARAVELARQGVLSHIDGQGRSPALQMLNQGFPVGEFGEVLGAGPDLASVWTAWLASPPHRAVLSTSGWTQWGWGRSGKPGSFVWVIRFWKP